MLEYLFDLPSEKNLIRPPGAPDELEFLLTCQRCGKCVQACEYGSIKIAGGETGMAVGTPFLDLRHSYCRMCMRCIYACENGILKNVDGRLKIGRAKIDKRLCLAWDHVVCMTCHSYCPEGAVELDSELRPEVNEKCTGCGLCESVCLKYPSIKVRKIGSIW